MEITDELIQEVFSFEPNKSIWRKDFNSKEFKLCDKLNRFLFDERLEQKAGCECVEIFFFKLKRKFKNTSIQKIMEQKFKIKSGKAIISGHFQAPLTERSSDEDCIKLLKLNKKYASQFSVLPKDWEAIIEDENSGKELDLSKLNLKALQEKATELEIEFVKEATKDVKASTKAELISLIQASLEATKEAEKQSENVDSTKEAEK